jgi:hypothetical protein
MIVATVLLLKLLNWVPLNIHYEGMKRYKDIEDARTALKLKKVLLPSYFPQYLEWPPAEIFAQKEPFVTVLMHFTRRDNGETVLAIRQSDARQTEPVRTRIDPERIRTEENITIKGRPARLYNAVCPGRRSCTKVVWQEEGYSFTVIGEDSPGELLRLAESMLQE